MQVLTRIVIQWTLDTFHFQFAYMSIQHRCLKAIVSEKKEFKELKQGDGLSEAYYDLLY
jgi:hypothetical protein